MRTCEHPRRPGFTLIELLVAMAILITLAALAVAFLPNIGAQQRVADGAGQLQQMLLTAKQKALRDGRPRGVRLLLLDPAGKEVTKLQYVEQPDDFFGGKLSTSAAGST